MLRQRWFGTILTLAGLACFCGAATDSKSADSKPTDSKPAALAATDAGTSHSVSEQVDRLLAQEIFLKQTNADLAPIVDDEAFLRRVSLDLVGELPTPSEVTLFLLDPAKDKRAKLVDRLLADSRFGRNWGRYWRDVIMYRRIEDRALLASRPLEEFLTEQLNRNVGWDRIAQQFIEAKGIPQEAGQTALIFGQGADPNDVAAETSRIFLGISIQCAQCHDHPTDRWKREQFHEFVAFFPRTQLRPILSEGRVRGFEIASFDVAPRFRPPQAAMNPGRGALEHYMPDLKNPKSEGKLMTPVFFATGRKLATGKTDNERRSTLADWLTSREDSWFAKAFVNRIWAEMVGEGFYEPVDDLGPDRPCSAPQTIAYLAGEFSSHEYDIKWLYRTVLATDAYQRQSRARRLPDQAPFTANCPQRLRGDQLYNVLMGALGFDPSSAPSGPTGYGGRFAGSPRFTFNTVFGFDPSQRRDEVSGSIPQALVLMNSRQVGQAINARDKNSSLGKLLADSTDNEEVVVELYLRCLARQPKSDEVTACLDYVGKTGDRVEAFEDILWALINRTEFLQRN
jgi:hypothetical protein